MVRFIRYRFGRSSPLRGVDAPGIREYSGSIGRDKFSRLVPGFRRIADRACFSALRCSQRSAISCDPFGALSSHREGERAPGKLDFVPGCAQVQGAPGCRGGKLTIKL